MGELPVGRQGLGGSRSGADVPWILEDLPAEHGGQLQVGTIGRRNCRSKEESLRDALAPIRGVKLPSFWRRDAQIGPPLPTEIVPARVEVARHYILYVRHLWHFLRHVGGRSDNVEVSFPKNLSASSRLALLLPGAFGRYDRGSWL